MQCVRRVLLLVSFVSCASSIEWDDGIRDQVAQMAETVLDCRQMAALNLAIVHNNETLMAGGFGLADIAATRSVDADTRFGIASISKGFAATLLAKVLSEQTT
jgi:beta-lactamase class C